MIVLYVTAYIIFVKKKYHPVDFQNAQKLSKLLCWFSQVNSG
jgi:hypothetical protein